MLDLADLLRLSVFVSAAGLISWLNSVRRRAEGRTHDAYIEAHSANVAKDLPPLVAAIRKNGLEASMVTTDVVDADTPYTEDVLKTASSLGIRYYRFGAFKWAADKPFAAQLEAMKPRLANLAALNAKYQACAMYHTHSGVGVVGASIWDLWYLMKDLDPKLVAPLTGVLSCLRKKTALGL